MGAIHMGALDSYSPCDKIEEAEFVKRNLAFISTSRIFSE